MAANWWHMAQTPNGPYAHQLDPVELDTRAAAEMADDPHLDEAAALSEVLAAAGEEIRVSLGFPRNGRWVTRDEWDSSASVGEPHPKFLRACRDAGHEPASWPLES